MNWASILPITLPKTSSLPMKIGRAPKGNEYSNHPFSSAMLVLGRVPKNAIFEGSCFFSKTHHFGVSIVSFRGVFLNDTK